MLLSMERTIAFPIPVGERVKVATAYSLITVRSCVPPSVEGCLVKEVMHAIDIQRFIDALAIESRARKRLLRQSEA